MSFSTVGAASTDPTVNGTTAPLGDPDGPDAALAGLGQARRIGRYTLLELLGHGGMGVVFAAYDEELDRKVAIKFMHHAGGDPRARAALLGEAQALARLAHPNVIHVYEVGETGDQVFLAMEFVRGQTLRQWLRQPRPWPEVVAMFLQAGRGLAAAHQAGLVHCDFKPENALVGQDGRLRVLDFGLARRQEPDAATNAATDAATNAATAATDAATTNTTAAPRPADTRPRGGTPGYIPPEQYEQRPVDARSDQFSFCVALFEALHGQRPFAGDTPVALMLQVLGGEVRGAPGEAKVPARLRRAIRRGLALDPAARHPTMAALLAELTDTLPRPRSAWLIAAAVSAALTSVTWALLTRSDDPATSCAATVAAELDALWGPNTRTAVQRAFAATNLPYAGDSFARSARLLDAHLESWAALRQRTCELAPNPDTPAPGARCLDRHRRTVSAWVDVLRDADATVVEQAVAATAELPDPQPCVDPATLLIEDAPEQDPERAAAASDIEGLLAQGRALELAGQYERALPPVLAARERARELGLLRLESAALLRLGLLQEHTGDGARAADSLAAAYFTAEAAHHRVTRAEAAVHLVHVTGGPPRSREEDALWARLAGSIAAGLGESALDLRAALLQHRSRAAIARDSLDPARADLEAALELETRRLGPGHPALAAIHEQLGEVLRLAGRDDEALAHVEQAIAVAEATLGPEHPSTARRILGRAQVHERRGDLAAALRDDLHALAVWERAYGEHPRLIWPLTCAGRVLRKADRLADAEPHYARALAIAERTHGPTHPEVARALIELGDLLRGLGRAPEARALHGRALTILLATSADATTWRDLGETLLADGATAEASTALERARLAEPAP
jgi:tetratricopeptide (TPR) repeat protein/predicted Ser/Thr protein kinase